MKLLLVAVSAIAFFTADGRNFRNEPGNQDSTSEAQSDSGETVGHGWLNLVDGTEVQVTTGQDQQLGQNNVYADGIEKSDLGHEGHEMKESNVVVAGDYQDQDSIILNLQERRKYERKSNISSCKAKTTCVLLGGSCVTNATLCSGRLLPQECKGKNCQCCVLDTIEAKLDSLEEEILLFKNSMNESNLYLKTELKDLGDKLENTNSTINSKLDNMSLNINNMSSKTDTIEAKLDSLEEQILLFKNSMNESNLHLKTELKDLGDNLENTNSTINSKLDNMTLNSNIMSSNIHIIKSILYSATECPVARGFFVHSGQCFKFLNDSGSSWSDAKTRCGQLGLVLAKPSEPVALRIVMVAKYGEKASWIGARGSGSSVVWDRDGTTLSTSDTAWKDGHPGSRTSTTYCLEYLTRQYNINHNPTKPYYMNPCTSTWYPLCELV